MAVNRTHRVPVAGVALDELSPAVFLSDIQGPGDDVAGYAQEKTPKTAVFLTPPNLDRFLFTARRAIVVGFKAFPFGDEAMLEWRRRIRDCYGEVRGAGFHAEKEMIANYRHITEQKMRFIARKYGAAYAVLYEETPTAFPVLHQNTPYKLVKIEDGT
ncbi:MAG TPA: DUF6798 domain-containing protein [Planctomycetota bacterium]|nr:DUF6798 domain-containing protein [Planctomycetota bacterium]